VDQSTTPRFLGLEEPAVTLTDLGVAIEAAICTVLIATTQPTGHGDHRRAGSLRHWLAVFFGATAVAAATGAALHGIRSDRAATARRRLWRISLGSIGVASLSSWRIAAGVTRVDDRDRPILPVVTAAHGAYLAVLPFTQPPYAVAIATYLPGAVALGGSLAGRVSDDGWRRPAALGLTALGLTFVAAVVQLRRIGIDPRYFDHNALYHTLQAAGIAVFLASGQGLVKAVYQIADRR
jgi:hypothetical protein